MKYFDTMNYGMEDTPIEELIAEEEIFNIYEDEEFLEFIETLAEKYAEEDYV